MSRIQTALSVLLVTALALLAPVSAGARPTGQESNLVKSLRQSTTISNPAAITYVQVGDRQLGFALAPEGSSWVGSGANLRTVSRGGVRLGEILVPRGASVTDGGCIPYPAWLKRLRGGFEIVVFDETGQRVAGKGLSAAEVQAWVGGDGSSGADSSMHRARIPWSKVLRAVAKLLLTAADLIDKLEQPVSIAAPGTPSWTPWLDRDGPGGAGDYETLSDFLKAGQACPQPREIECQAADGRDSTETGQAYTCEPDIGGVCRNQDQQDRRCLNYRVRFRCD